MYKQYKSVKLYLQQTKLKYLCPWASMREEEQEGTYASPRF